MSLTTEVYSHIEITSNGFLELLAAYFAGIFYNFVKTASMSRVQKQVIKLR
jgi:hypothetical protein